jgi:hypothetical protein
MRVDKELRAAIKEEISPIKQDIARLEQNMSQLDQDMTRLKILMENDIQKQLNLLAEGQRLILERLPKPGVIEELQDRVDTHEIVLTKHSVEIAALKKAL